MALADDYVFHIDQSIHLAEMGLSRLHPLVYDIDGMSGRKYRHFLNNLMRFSPTFYGHARPIKYLEIGSWKGSTLCSAICNNAIFAVSIDNFSEFQDMKIVMEGPAPPEAIKDNIAKTVAVSPIKSKVLGLKQDCFVVNPLSLSIDFDVYFYDGEHSYDSQYRAFTHFDPCLADTCVVLVDDYAIDVPNPPREATQQAFKDLGYRVHKDWYLFNGNATLEQALAEWWNGVYVAVIEKTKTRRK